MRIGTLHKIRWKIVSGTCLILAFLMITTAAFAYHSDYMFARHEAIRNLGLVLVGVISAPLLIWRTLIASRQSKTGQKQAEIADKNHLAGTFSQALEQLGAYKNEHPILEIRIGGLYTLEKIALSNEDYHPQIMEVLCSYIRLNHIAPSEPQTPRTDILAALTIIGRREIKFDNEKPDLSGCNFGAITIERLSLPSVNLSGSIFKGAILEWAHLTNANFTDANLIGVNFTAADFQGAHCGGANLTNANLNRAHCREADFMHGQLNKACLVGADLRGANLIFAHIEEANFDRTNLMGACLNSVKFDGVTGDNSYIKEYIKTLK